MSLCPECEAEMGPGFADVHRYHHEKWLKRGEGASTEPEGTPVDMPHPLYVTLWRIAVALEEQNRFNWQWLEQSRAWHEENKENGNRITAIHEENARRDQTHRAQMESMAEKQAGLVREMLQESYEAYVESLKSPSKELVKAVGEALANDMRKSTGKREP